MITAVDETLCKIVNDLGLKKAADGVFIGMVTGFPVGLQIFENEISTVFLFQIRFPARDKINEAASIEGTLKELAKLRGVEAEIESNAIWLTIPDARAFGDDTMPFIREFLDELIRRGFEHGLEVCHYCKVEKVNEPRWLDGKLAQVCERCVERRTERPRQSTSILTNMPLAILTAVSIPIAAAGWVLVWIGLDRLLELFNTRVIIVPRLLAAIGVLVIAGLTGGPIALAIRRVPTRTAPISGVCAVLGVLCAVAVGELAYLSWAIFRQFHLFSPAAALRILPRFWGALDFALFLRLGALVAAAVLAYIAAQPAKAKLRL